MSKRYTYRQTEKITRTNERIRVLRPKSRILKVPFQFTFSVSVSVSGSGSVYGSVSGSVFGSVSGSVSVVRGIAPYI